MRFKPVEDRPGTVILRALRYAGWIERSDLYVHLGCSGEDPTRRNTIQQAMIRLREHGFVELDAERGMYRITPAGRAELVVRLDPIAYEERQTARARAAVAHAGRHRWPRARAA
jgi:hypothetical protein